MTGRRHILTSLMLLCSLLGGRAQSFFNLTAEQVSLGEKLPEFTYIHPLGEGYADSVYQVRIEYPEFIDMGEADVARLHELTADSLPELPVVEQHVGVSRRQGGLYVSFMPLVCRGGRLQKLVSFKLAITASPRPGARRQVHRAASPANRYAAHSVLASGNWAKIRVPATGFYQLTESLVRQCGFSDLSRVRIYGYGGAWQPETLTGDYLQETDDLKEVPSVSVGGRRVFHAVGPVNWATNQSAARLRNPYSDYGYYFLTEGEPQLTDSATLAANYPHPNDYHSLHEVDDYAIYHSGRNLQESTLLSDGQPHAYTLETGGELGTLTATIVYEGRGELEVQLNDSVIGTIAIRRVPSESNHEKAATYTWSALVSGLRATNTVKLTYVSGANMRLDYLSLSTEQPRPMPAWDATLPQPEYVYRITNQDHHADAQADMVIIIPTSQKLLAQAERLKRFHEEQDGMRVNIVPADELYNEFSSGTPDANAYRRYLKMLYDRAQTEADMPSYLLLLGDAAWDNRMRLATWQSYSPDDFLLCYESDDSFSETNSYVTDDYFCLMDDDEGSDIAMTDKADVAVGRISARTNEEAAIVVDKTINYVQNKYAGAWQNVICLMGDDGNDNMHMDHAESVAQMIRQNYPGYEIKRIYWDAYNRKTSSTGNTYPDVTRLIKQQMQSGALIMNYTGHGAPYMFSHEQAVKLADFAEAAQNRLPLWFTASCDIAPFDSHEENIGETAMFNKTGGGVAFVGTTRTVIAANNAQLNRAFTPKVLAPGEDGRPMAIGEALRQAKIECLNTRINRLHFAMLGDPALRLAVPRRQAVVDEINGQPVASGRNVTLGAGSLVKVAGHVVGTTDFNGVVTANVSDAEQTIVCKLNADADTAFWFRDRPNTIYNGSDSVRAGQFNFSFAVPKDIQYSEGTGLITLYAIDEASALVAHGENGQFVMNADSTSSNDGIGPSIYCYLNSSSFSNGDNVNTTPFFYATLSDNDGINASGGGIGHDLELTIDGDMDQTYNLNEYFQYDFGDFRSGSVGYTIPELAEGPHKLRFRAWDILNNSSTAELTFNVVKSLEPQLFSIDCTRNPATTATTFIISHDRIGSTMNVDIDLFDMSGRQIWRHSSTGISTEGAYTVDWDLTVDGGRRLQTGVYLYRVRVSTNGSSEASKAKKLIVIGNK